MHQKEKPRIADENKTSVIILAVTSAIAAVLPLLPYECVDRNLVPTIIFKGLPSTFHGFIISIMFAFSGAFSTLFLHNKPTISSFCRCYSMVSAASALGLLIFAMSAASLHETAGAFSTWFQHNKPTISSFCRCYSMLSAASALGLLIFAMSAASLHETAGTNQLQRLINPSYAY